VKAGVLDAVGRFARVVSDAKETVDVLAVLADALVKHVCPDGVAVYSLAADGGLHLAAARGIGEGAPTVVDMEEVGHLGVRLQKELPRVAAHVTRPLVAGGNLFGCAAMLFASDVAGEQASVADVFLDLAAISLGTAAHVAQLERQYDELRQQQEMLVRTEKLRALGQMAAGVSHDLKNILNPLSLHIQVVLRALDRDNKETAKESAVEMKQVLQRGLQTLERLRGFSRQSNEAKEELVALDALAREAMAIGKSRAASAGGRVPRVVEELSSPPPVSAVSGDVVSALVNLVVNAIDAMASAPGTITLRSGTCDVGSWIEVGDSGPGMPAEVAKRVFEPFFTTKGAEGTGLGLAMVYATMQRHGGTASVQTSPGNGTIFRLTFPAQGHASMAPDRQASS
jgi:signal transduction histidine kinase